MTTAPSESETRPSRHLPRPPGKHVYAFGVDTLSAELETQEIYSSEQQ